LTCCNFIFPV